MKKLVGIVVALVAMLGLSACATFSNIDTQARFDAACNRADGIVNAVQVLVDAGELSSTQVAQFNDAKATVGVICSQAFPQDLDEALYTTATVYVTLAKMLRD